MITSYTSESGDQSGFGLVELLVALVIGSGLVLSLGGLITYASAMWSRVSETSAIEESLIDLRATKALLDSVFPGGGPIGTALSQQFASADGGLSATLTEKPLSLIVTFGARQTFLHLASFDSTRFEYLVRRGTGWSWTVALSPRPEDVAAVRLVLQRRSSVWPMLMWSAGSPATGQGP